jgi:hypothetical protein
MKIMQKHQTLTTEDVQKLFSKFAEPVMRGATTANRLDGALGLTKSLWLVMLTGGEAESRTFNYLEKKVGIPPEDLEDVKARYYLKMKPSITKKELARLKEYYNLQTTMEF